MRRYLAPAAAVAVAMTLFLAGIAVAQSGALAGLAQPVVVSIEQLVPVDVTLALPQEDGSVITTTAPLTVGVSLQIMIDGNQVVAVAPAAEAEPAEVAVATEAPAPESDDPWAAIPHIASAASETQSIGGVDLQVEKVSVYDLATAAEMMPELKDLLDNDSFGSATAIGVATLAFTNTTDSKLRLDPSDGVVVINNEQVDLSNYRYFGDEINGDMFPGVMKSGRQVFALQRTPWADIQDGAEMFIDLSQPIDSDDYSRLGDTTFQFTLELQP